MGCGCGFGMRRWACIIATQPGADFGWRHVGGPLPKLPAPSARFAARFAVPEHRERPPPSLPTRHGKEGGVGGRGHSSKATPGPAPCSVHSSRLGVGGGWWMGSLSVSLPSVCLHSSNPDYPSPAWLLFFCSSARGVPAPVLALHHPIPFLNLPDPRSLSVPACLSCLVLVYIVSSSWAD